MRWQGVKSYYLKGSTRYCVGVWIPKAFHAPLGEGALPALLPAPLGEDALPALLPAPLGEDVLPALLPAPLGEGSGVV